MFLHYISECCLCALASRCANVIVFQGTVGAEFVPPDKATTMYVFSAFHTRLFDTELAFYVINIFTVIDDNQFVLRGSNDLIIIECMTINLQIMGRMHVVC